MAETDIGRPYGQEQEPLQAPPGHEEAPPGHEEAPLGHPASKLEPAEPLRLNSDQDLSRVGFWTVALSGLGVCVGIAFLLAGGILPGVFVVGVALICGSIGALALGLVAHHQG